MLQMWRKNHLYAEHSGSNDKENKRDDDVNLQPLSINVSQICRYELHHENTYYLIDPC